jgi:preprotein translocase subunit SecD
MRLFLLPVLILALYSCGTKSIEKNGGIKVRLSSDCKDYAKITAILESRLLSMEISDCKIYTENDILCIDIPDYFDIDAISKLLCTKGDLSFYATYECKETFDAFGQINSNLTDSADTSANIAGPLFSIFYPQLDQSGNLMEGPESGSALGKDSSTINQYIMENIRLFPAGYKALWSESFGREGYFTLIGINTEQCISNTDGNMVTEASLNKEYGNNIDFTMNHDYAMQWAKMTRENMGRSIAIVIDGKLFSYPRVHAEITEGKSCISGNFELSEAKVLTAILNSGSLPCNLQIIDIESVKEK